jgi:hypothetical protein
MGGSHLFPFLISTQVLFAQQYENTTAPTLVRALQEYLH